MLNYKFCCKLVFVFRTSSDWLYIHEHGKTGDYLWNKLSFVVGNMSKMDFSI
jgi:hypothetical protein